MQASDRGFTLIELLIVVAIISIIAAIAVPGLLSAKITANEASAIASVRAIGVAQTAYSATCGNGGFATSLVVLGATPPSGAQPFLSADLGLTATPQKAGYNFAMTAGVAAAGANDCESRQTNSGFYVTAVPMTYGSTGTRAFSINSSVTIWQSTSATPPPEPFTTSATISPVH